MVEKRIKNDVFVYAEGGGSGTGSSALQREFAQAFAVFLSKTDLGTTRRPRMVACGGREQAFDRFCTAVKQGQNALLLVDSESLVAAQHEPPAVAGYKPWSHLAAQAGWNQPGPATDADAHFMVPCMENWFLADWKAVASFFGHGFKAAARPTSAIEKTDKTAVYTALEAATAACRTKLPYGKGAHSFKLLALVDPALVETASPWAKRFLDELRKRKR
ncbi:DUF4276 family protein [Acidovorax sp. NCPPB 4044]|uniref:DUF4276 family protein n=1 Tax=Acidovorax sp. NCPPB 4044 TaxID=2940490 RepID=UPI002303F251|nr:DUF4276 family protein [Acidovorax sp. NCPPB 4044]MDA8519469.1 DUF4276 family protein [Acidovorax sp. NCPPB 4044]